MVDLEPLDEEDRATVDRLIRQHVELTGSPRGKAVLAHPEDTLSRFVKVLPHDFKRVLAASAETREQPSRIAQEADHG
jgi:glutamate synthase domain-containing protein 3